MWQGNYRDWKVELNDSHGRINPDELYDFIQTLSEKQVLNFVNLNDANICNNKDWTETTILHKLMSKPFLSIIDKKKEEMICNKNKAGNTPLHYLCIQFIHIERSMDDDEEISPQYLKMLKIFCKRVGNIDCPIKTIKNYGWVSIEPHSPYDYLYPKMKEFCDWYINFTQI